MSRSADLLEPGTAARLGWLLSWAETQDPPINILVTETGRTWARQANLYARGRTARGRIVTNARPGFSWHNFGRAFDLCFLKGKRAVYTGPWDRVAAKAREIGLTWGGDFKTFPDRPHFQYEFDAQGVRRPLSYYRGLALISGRPA